MSDNDAEARRRILRLQKLGRFLSRILKHHSTRFPIHLDAEGYASLKDVMHILKRLPNFRWANMPDVKAVLDLPGPQRFELREEKGRDIFIRACDGHTPIQPHKECVVPPDMLYYGAAPEALIGIKENGLTAPDGQYIRMAENHATARSIAVRVMPDPIILHIDAASALLAGIKFYSAAPCIYLSETIPPEFIQEFKA